MAHPVTSEKLLVLFHQASHLAMRELHRNGSHAQGRILSILDAQGSLGQKVLLEHLGTRAASLSELLGKLEKSGLIVRHRDSMDKRSSVVELTDKGRIAAAEAKTELQNGITGLFAPLDETERAELVGLLSKLIISWSADTTKCNKSPRVDAVDAERMEAEK